MNSSAKVLKIDVIEKKKRLDGDVDHLVKLIMAGEEVYYLALRITDVSAISLWVDTTTSGLIESSIKFVSIRRKRTLIACARLLIKTHPAVLTNSPSNYYRLIKDDTDARQRIVLAKRKWKVHQLALWSNGYFVARLSCTKESSLLSNNTQFVLHPSKFDLSNGGASITKSGVYLRHGSFNSPVKVNIPQLKFILRHSEEWPKLSVMLNEAEYGYSTEVEAKDGFDKLVSREDIVPASIIKNSLTNSIRQVKPDNELPVTIIDTYKNYHEAAWLFHAGDEHFIMRMEAHTEGKVTLVERGVSTVFKNIDQAARQLISLCKSKGMSGDTKELAVSAWQEMITRDLNFRYFCEQLNADWLVTDIAKQQGEPVAIIAQCFTSSVFAVPVYAKLKTYKVLLVESGRIIDPSRRGDRYPSSNKINLAEFKESIKELETNTFNKVPLKLKDALVLNRGFVTRNEATKALESAVLDEIKVLTAGACPILPHQRLNAFEFSAKQSRERIARRINLDKADTASLDKLELSLVDQQTYPLQLIEALIGAKLLTSKCAADISLSSNPYRDEIGTDETTIIKTKITGANTTQISISNMEQEDDTRPIKSTIKSNAGRKRKYADDKEKKRIWAQKHRDKLKADKIQAGIEVEAPGRKKIYETAAEKQSAYRFKTKWEALAIDSSLLLVGLQPSSIKKSDVNLQINKAMSYFGTNALAMLQSDSADSTRQHAIYAKELHEVLPNLPINNIHMDESEKLLTLLLDVVTEKNYKQVHICGEDIAEHCFIVAMALKNAGVKVMLHKGLCIQRNKKDQAMALNIFKKVFGKKSVL